MIIQLIRSATLRLSIAGVSFLIDPWLAAKGEGRSYGGQARSPLVGLPIPEAMAVGGIDAVLVSHLHSDHLDDAAIDAIGSGIPVIAPARDVDQLISRGFIRVTGVADRTCFGPVEIELTSGRHGPDEVLGEMGAVSGFVFRAPGEPVLYWAGDTILCDEVRDVIWRTRPDVVVVHGCGATWGGVGPLVMDAGMVIETARLAEGAKVVVTHMDAVDHATVTRADIQSALRNPTLKHTNVLVPLDGDILEFTPSMY